MKDKDFETALMLYRQEIKRLKTLAIKKYGLKVEEWFVAE